MVKNNIKLAKMFYKHDQLYWLILRYWHGESNNKIFLLFVNKVDCCIYYIRCDKHKLKVKAVPSSGEKKKLVLFGTWICYGTGIFVSYNIEW